jgi:dihydroorotase
MIGLETTIPLLLGLVRDGVLSPLRFVEVMSTAPARVGRLRRRLAQGRRAADITILDPDLRWTVSRERSAASSSTLLARQELVGACTHTLVDGELVFDAIGTQ